jgi:uridine phosphorylase
MSEERPVPPILEFDPTREAVIEPSRILKPRPVPEHAVLCFFREVIEHVVETRGAQVVARMKSEMGIFPIYATQWNGQPLAFFHPGVGAPLAAAALEQSIAFGCRKFVVCGGAGVLHADTLLGHLFVPESAVRDEGTSYHYLPPAREVAPTPRALTAIEAVLAAHELRWVRAKTWTTDAIFRETRAKIERRVAEGCATVEMEAAAFFAVAEFRGVELAEILYAGDDLSQPEWDPRGWMKERPVRDRLFEVAAEACLRL